MNEGIATAIDAFGRRWNGYETRGTEHLPPAGSGGLIVFYHGFLPLDAWYFGTRYYLETGRIVHGLGDRWLFKVPGLSQLVTSMGSAEGTRENAVNWLQSGELVGVSPGGTREAIKGRREHYTLKWGHRLGFVEVAMEAGVPMFPAFTENVEELYRSPLVGSRPIQALYERTRWPIVPVVGLGPLPLPVKLTSHIGPGVVARPGESAADVRQRVADGIRALIAAHQSSRPRIPRALLQRFRAGSDSVG